MGGQGDENIEEGDVAQGHGGEEGGRGQWILGQNQREEGDGREEDEKEGAHGGERVNDISLRAEAQALPHSGPVHFEVQCYLSSLSLSPSLSGDGVVVEGEKEREDTASSPGQTRECERRGGAALGGSSRPLVGAP